MRYSLENKEAVIEDNRIHDGDTGSAHVQVALITARLAYLQDHFKSHKKDHHSRRGLLKLVGRRKSLLNYIKKKNVQSYRDLIQKLGIRK